MTSDRDHRGEENGMEDKLGLVILYSVLDNSVHGSARNRIGIL